MQAHPFAAASPRIPVLVAGAAVAATTVMVLAASNALALAAFAAAFLIAAFAVRFSAHVPGLYLNLLGVVLAGYALFGRSFAYLGLPPVYIGEITLACGVVALLMTGALRPILSLPQTWLVMTLALWGAIQTVPYLDEYGIDALRDATVWGYAAYAIVVAAVVLAVGFRPVVARYARAVPWFAVSVPLMVIAGRLLAGNMPMMPGTDMPLLTNKMGDAGVHLAGAAAFVLAFGAATGSRWKPSTAGAWLFWAAWLAALVCVAGANRGGFLAIAVALAVLAFLNPREIGRRVGAAAAGVALVGGIVTLAAVTIDRNGQLASSSEDRAVSPRQIAANIASIVSTDADDVLTGTREWRLDWWRDIAAYTVNGPYFWTGKGFGVNLADDDHFQVSVEVAPLRSPHSVHMTFLARAGVPGLMIWVVLNVAFGIGMLRAYVRARRADAGEWAALNLWLLAYWTAFLVDASFDVFLEGPQGGIWFWSVFGLGLAALAAQRSLRPSVAPEGAIAG